LDIGNNAMTAEGAEALAKWLTGNKHITELKVYMNDIGNGGMYKVAEALKSCSKLEHLDLGGNNFGEEGMAVLAAALKGKETLKHLDVSSVPPLSPHLCSLHTLTTVVEH
jgi:Ran GTPase-activating protein (RanGAP) involved in mRNA processing and transport